MVAPARPRWARAQVSLAWALAGLVCFGGIAAVLVPSWTRGWMFSPLRDFLVAIALFVGGSSSGIAAVLAGGGQAGTGRATTGRSLGRVLGVVCVVIAVAAFVAFVAGLVLAMTNLT